MKNMKNLVCLVTASLLLCSVASAQIVGSSWGKNDRQLQQLLDDIEDITVAIDDDNHTSSLEMNACVALEGYLSVLWELYHLKGQVDVVGTLGFEVAGNGAWGYVEADAFLELLIDLGVAVDIGASLCLDVPIVTVGEPTAQTAGLVVTTPGLVTDQQALSLEEELTVLADEIRAGGLEVAERVAPILDELGMAPDDLGHALGLLGEDVHTLIDEPLDLLDPDRFADRLGALPVVGRATGVVDVIVNQAQDNPCGLVAGLPDAIVDAVSATCDLAEDGIETMEDLVRAIDSLEEIERLLEAGIALTVQQLESLLNVVKSTASQVLSKANTILSAAKKAVKTIECLKDPLSC